MTKMTQTATVKHTGDFSKSFPKATIWEFNSTGEAYDASQTDDLTQGDILYIPSEGVVGFVDTWPFAISKKSGDLHSVVMQDGQLYWDTASDLARSMGFPEDHIDCARFMQARIHLEESKASAWVTLDLNREEAA